METPCPRTIALFKPGESQPGVMHCYSRKKDGEPRICELCGSTEPTVTKQRPKKGAFEDVFGHLGTPEQVATQWITMQNRIEYLEKLPEAKARMPLKAHEINDALFDSIGENIDTYDLRMFDFAREIEKRHEILPPPVPAVAS